MLAKAMAAQNRVDRQLTVRPAGAARERGRQAGSFVRGWRGLGRFWLLVVLLRGSAACG